jgi:hypothetical protein
VVGKLVGGLLGYRWPHAAAAALGPPSHWSLPPPSSSSKQQRDYEPFALQKALRKEGTGDSSFSFAVALVALWLTYGASVVALTVARDLSMLRPAVDIFVAEFTQVIW